MYLFCFANLQPPPTDFPVSSVTSSTPHLQGQTPPTGVPAFTKGALPGVRPMYPPSSSAVQSTGPVPTYPTSSVYGPPGMTQGAPSVVQPGTAPPYPPSSAAAKSQQYPPPSSSKPSPMGPGMGVRSAAVTSNDTGSLSDGFNSMHLQVGLLLLLDDGAKS